MRAALWRSQRGAEPPRARSGEACGARGTGRSLQRGEAARRPTGTRRARPCSGRGGGAGGYPPRLPAGSESERPTLLMGRPRTCAKPDILWAKPETGLRSKLAQNVVLRRCGREGTAGRLGPRRPRMGSCSHLHRGSGTAGGAGVPIRPAEKNRRCASGHGKESPSEKARIDTPIRALSLLSGSLE